MAAKLFVVSASSGAGKTSLVYALLQRVQNECALSFVATYTTRMPRPHEVQGKDYHFVTPELFERHRNEHFFIECSQAYGAWYGSPRIILDLLQKGISCIVILDIAGVEAMIARVPERVAIRIDVSRFEELAKRLAQRDTDPSFIEKRMAIARQESEDIRTKSLYRYHILNDDVENTVCRLQDIVKSELFA